MDLSVSLVRFVSEGGSYQLARESLSACFRKPSFNSYLSTAIGQKFDNWFLASICKGMQKQIAFDI